MNGEEDKEDSEDDGDEEERDDEDEEDNEEEENKQDGRNSYDLEASLQENSRTRCKRLQEMKDHPNEASNTINHADQLYYDFHYLNEHFTEQELRNEPRPNKVWAHITCSLFIPEMYFLDKDRISEIDGKKINHGSTYIMLGFQYLSRDRFKIDCTVCGKRSDNI